uniref:Chaperonin-like RbcX protein 2, chloroplastic n=1 Tax=Nelumbo nucifera TaxID=4432 RepID=A0A822ZG12_NELNU|nr:TPA_asm: hypothetical protein HUJ06_000585 [Nelumbo nucifera]
MVGALSIVGSSMVDTHASPCLCLDVLSSSSMNFKSSGDLGLYRSLTGKKQFKRPGTLELSSSFIDAWHESRLSFKAISGSVNQRSKRQRKARRLVIVNEVAGQYEDSFDDVKTQLLNYFTYKAVRTVLNQLYEMNPTQYRWFYDFVVTNKPGDGKRFIHTLAKKCDHGAIYKEISDQNLELMRERLMETVIWPSDDTNTPEKIG